MFSVRTKSILILAALITFAAPTTFAVKLPHHHALKACEKAIKAETAATKMSLYRKNSRSNGVYVFKINAVTKTSEGVEIEHRMLCRASKRRGVIELLTLEGDWASNPTLGNNKRLIVQNF